MSYILLDIEATCWDNPDMQRRQEVIELGAIKLDEYRSVKGQFESLVRPQIYPRLSRFCTELTGIDQQMVSEAPEFKTVINHFLEWGEVEENTPLIIAWGDFDRQIIRQNLEYYDLETRWTDQYINLRRQYRRKRNGGKTIGLKRALEREGFEFEGDHHRALSDVVNMYKLFYKHYDSWDLP